MLFSFENFLNAELVEIRTTDFLIIGVFVHIIPDALIGFGFKTLGSIVI